LTNQDKIKYLKQYKALDRRINLKLAECEEWRDMAKKITQEYTDMPKGNGGVNRLEMAVENIDRLEREMNGDIDRLVDLRRDIQQAIKSVADETLQELLERRYIHGQTFERIADEMHYAWRHIHRLHSQALDVIECHIAPVI